eukprot:scaffold3614_cov123-Isochrysis_galbana.AAC.5
MHTRACAVPGAAPTRRRWSFRRRAALSTAWRERPGCRDSSRPRAQEPRAVKPSAGSAAAPLPHAQCQWRPMQRRPSACVPPSAPETPWPSSPPPEQASQQSITQCSVQETSSASLGTPAAAWRDGRVVSQPAGAGAHPAALAALVDRLRRPAGPRRWDPVS